MPIPQDLLTLFCQDRVAAWRALASRLPELGVSDPGERLKLEKVISGHVRDIQGLEGVDKASVGRGARQKLPKSHRNRKRWCTICRSPWPHSTPEARRRHMWRIGLPAWRRRYWARFSPGERRRRMAPVIEARRRRALERRLAIIPEHVVRVLGREGVRRRLEADPEFRRNVEHELRHRRV